MANDEDLARLRQGVAAWNEWQAQNPEYRRHIRIDLRGANLRAANLTEADLTEANLTGRDLRAADLTRANPAGLLS